MPNILDATRPLGKGRIADCPLPIPLPPPPIGRPVSSHPPSQTPPTLLVCVLSYYFVLARISRNYQVPSQPPTPIPPPHCPLARPSPPPTRPPTRSPALAHHPLIKQLRSNCAAPARSHRRRAIMGLRGLLLAEARGAGESAPGGRPRRQARAGKSARAARAGKSARPAADQAFAPQGAGEGAQRDRGCARRPRAGRARLA